MSRILLSCLGCSQDYDATAINCPRCVPVGVSGESARFKEAHTVAALEAAMDTAGLVHPDDEPLTISVMEELPTAEGAPKRYRAMEQDNSQAHAAAHFGRRAYEEAVIQGAKGAPSIPGGESRAKKEAHTVLGDSIAIGHVIKAALEAANAKAKDERAVRVASVAAALKANPASAIELAQKTDPAELADALRSLGVELPK